MEDNFYFFVVFMIKIMMNMMMMMMMLIAKPCSGRRGKEVEEGGKAVEEDRRWLLGDVELFLFKVFKCNLVSCQAEYAFDVVAVVIVKNK